MRNESEKRKRETKARNESEKNKAGHITSIWFGGIYVSLLLFIEIGLSIFCRCWIAGSNPEP